MTGTINRRIDGRTTVDFVGNIEAGHVVCIVTEKVQQHRSGMGHHFWHTTYGEILTVHKSTTTKKRKKVKKSDTSEIH